MGRRRPSLALVAALAGASAAAAFALADRGHRWLGLALLADACAWIVKAWLVGRDR